jgi:hypothetical protein
MRSISGPTLSDAAAATAAITVRAWPIALTDASSSRPISTMIGASTMMLACAASVASTSGISERASRRRFTPQRIAARSRSSVAGYSTRMPSAQ